MSIAFSHKRAITQGRTLFSCSQNQFEQFADPSRAVPRTGPIAEAVSILNCRLETRDGFWYVYDQEGTAVINAVATSRRAALVNWRNAYGLAKVKAKREADREWERMRHPGRPANDNPKHPERQQARSLAREASFARILQIWEKASSALVRHTAQADIWLRLSTQRDMPRLHTIRSVGNRKAIVDAVSHLYDVDGRAPLLRDLINGGEATDEQISATLMQDIPGVADRGEAGGVCARIALMLAILNSPEPAADVLLDLRDIMRDAQVQNVDELKLLCSLAVA